MKDRSGNMWIGVFAGGIDLYKKNKSDFTHYKHNSHSNSLSNDFVLSLFEDKDYNIWVGTDGGGLNMFNLKSDSLQSIKHNASDKNSISGDNILDIKPDDSEQPVDRYLGQWCKCDGFQTENLRVSNTIRQIPIA